MNEQVLLCAIQDLKEVLNKIENMDNYIEEGGFTFPIEFSIEFPCNRVYWLDINGLDIKFKYEKQYENYLKFLSRKRRINTVEKIEKLIFDMVEEL